MQKLNPKLLSGSPLTQLQHLQTERFTGSLVIEAENLLSWTFYFRMGFLIWAAGGVYQDERCHRHLALFCPEANIRELEQNVSIQEPHREYKILAKLQFQPGGLISQQKLVNLIRSTIAEVIFDAIQYSINNNHGPLLYSINPNDRPDVLLALIKTEQVCQQAIQAWSKWQKAALGAYSPNLFPVIKQPFLLQEIAETEIYQPIGELVDGTQTLRSLAAKSHRDLVALTSSLMPLVDRGTIFFSPSPTLKKFNLPLNAEEKQIDSPDSQQLNQAVAPSTGPTLRDSSSPLVACIDDSPMIGQILEKLISQQGYRFLGIQDPLKAIIVLLKSKPDFIFLDLMMPVTNGYDFCAHLRKIPSFKNVPIVMLTSRDGLVDRVRAKLVGSTDFLSKPLQEERLLQVLHKYLPIQAKPMLPDVFTAVFN